MMNQSVDEMIPHSTTTDTPDFTKDPDFTVDCRGPGKFLAKIRHPISKVWVYLGTYNTPEEAREVCARKKLEYKSGSLQDSAVSLRTDIVTDFEKHPGIKRMKNGKWGAVIIHNKAQVSLGRYDTPDEAMDAYNMSKLEMDSQEITYSIKDEIQLGFFDTAEDTYDKVMRQFDSITNVGRRGTFATVEDAQEALDRKKCELGLNGEDAEEGVNRKKCEIGSNGDAEQSERKQRRRHAYVCKSGRWRTEIRHPMEKGKKIHLGTFDTAEEAEDAYNSTRRQFDLLYSDSNSGNLSEDKKMREADLIARAHKKPRQRCSYHCKLDSGLGSSSLKDGIMQAVSSPFAAAHKREVGSRGSVYQEKAGKWRAQIQIRNVRHRLGSFATAEDALEALNRKKCELGLKGEDGQSDSICVSDDPFGSTSGSSMSKAGREEDAGESIINVNVETGSGEFDLGVIDSCGQLVGEYSKMDDELWIGLG